MKMRREELTRLIRQHVMTASAVSDYLQISKQSLSSLVKRKKLNPVLEEGAVRLFLRGDVEERKAMASQLREKYRPYE
ncbi:DNA-binding protein [Paenibacillus sp. 1P07SE]|uniref:DNA-binding protein n=1 Tax=Paenibacillus sp. 1P07SE TaxID=3132209 RepID=UPI0039A5E1B7